MARRKTRNQNINKQYRNPAYLYGTAVPKREYEQPPRRKTQREERVYIGNKRVPVNHAAYRNQQKALHMNGGYVAFLAVAALISLLVCVNYLKLQAEIAGHNESITEIEKQINTTKAQNDSLEYSIDSYVDLDYIYKTATQELGMVPATSDQVSVYESKDNEYMKQYDDIPKE